MKRSYPYFIVLALVTLAACYQKPKQTGQEGNKSDEKATVDSSLQNLNQKILEDPNNYLNYLNRAKYYGQRENYDLAFLDVARALQSDSTQDEIYLYKGELHWFRQDVKNAYIEYTNCLGKNDKNTDCLLKKAAIDIVLKNYEMAIGHINAALKENELLPYAYYLKGRLYRTIGDTNLAFSSYQTAIEVDPDYFDAYIELGLTYADKKHPLALEYYNQAIDIKPQSIEALYNKAIFLQDNGKKNPAWYRQAFECYDEILKIDPTWAAAHFNKGYVYLEYMQQYDSAAVEFSEAINLVPAYTKAYYNRGLSFESLNKTKEAKEDYTQALKLEPTFTDAAKALSRVKGEK
ncbi:MAG: tetratricopeptide repeat protein [Flavobacteriales bacterium]|nr:tetratricopeptide repeat protein [Flavobacteriales bacterium]